jgi:hypothetical protein
LTFTFLPYLVQPMTLPALLTVLTVLTLLTLLTLAYTHLPAF